VQRSLATVTSLLTEVEGTFQHVVPSTSQSGLVGRPKFEVSLEQLQYLVDLDLTTTDIAQAFGVSQSTKKGACVRTVFL
jgi:hypothetical protein